MRPFINVGVIIIIIHIAILLSFGTPFVLSSRETCSLDFNVLRELGQKAKRYESHNVTIQCQYILQGLRIVESKYLLESNSFLPSPDSAESCWDSYQSVVNEFIPNFDIRRTCGFQTSWISQGCMNITTRAEFEKHVSRAAIDDVVSACNRSLDSGSACSTCVPRISTLRSVYLTGDSVGNVSDCTAFALIYSGAVANLYGPTDPGTASCIFSIKVYPKKSKNKSKTIIICLTVVICLLMLALAVISVSYLRKKKKKKLGQNTRSESSLGFSGLDSIRENATLTKYTFDEIKEATRNFLRENILGRGGYGNVYEGVLYDGSRVALKRFKNTSVAGDAGFAHEVEVIASVRHVNLVALRGYCIATTQREGHQRIIVCDLMKNGSLYDHLFRGKGEKKLSWPVRQKIAIGTARGLAYLHYGVQPGIIHRDIKASNILLDEWFEPKVADFGLAKFTPEGMTHLSTRVAGTMGYIAPEYALYGQLTERSDVYSFGVLLLELLSGKQALVNVENGQPKLLADWAWSMVRKGRALDVIEAPMPDPGPPQVMEKYVMVAVLCSHPQLHARPTMDRVVKMLDTDVPVPSIPERPIPLNADIDDIENSVSVVGSARVSTSSGYQPYTPRGDSEKSFQPVNADTDDIGKSVSIVGSGRVSTSSSYQPYTPPRGDSEKSFHVGKSITNVGSGPSTSSGYQP